MEGEAFLPLPYSIKREDSIMLKRNYKKLVSVLSAAAMLTTLAAPAVMAEVAEEEIISASEMAELQAAVVILADDFENAEEKVIFTLDKSDQDPYTELDSVDVYIGKSPRGAAEDTKAEIRNGVGVDGSKALVFSSGAKASGTYGPRIDFKVPEIENNFMVTMDVYPTTNQDMTYSDAPSEALKTPVLFGLTPDEWNTVEIYVTRKGRVINVNGEKTVLSDTESASPVIWGNPTDNAGELYIDNISINALTTLPTPIPTPSPEPPYQPVIGDVFNFDNYSVGTLVSLNTSATPTYTALDGFELNVGYRTTGPSADTKVAIASGVGIDGSNALQLNHYTFADSNRGPRITLVAPKADTYMVSFYAKADEAMDIIITDSTGTNSGTAAGVPQDWTKIDIIMFDGQRLVLNNGSLVELKSTTDLPTLWGTHANNTGSFYIDDYSISEVSEEEIVNAIAQTLDITNSKNTVNLYDGVYEFIEGFEVANTACNESVTWGVFESTDEGATWAETTDLKAGKTAITLNGVTGEKLYKLVGTVSKGDLTASKEFILKYVASENVVDTVIERLDILSEIYEDNIKYDSATGEYKTWGDFVVPTSDWVTEITWESSDSSLVKIGPKGSILIYPKAPEKVTLTGTVSYNGESKTKEFTIDLANFYQECFRIVEAELVNAVLSPKGNNGEKVTSIELNTTGSTTLSYDVELKTSSSTKGIAIKWRSSDDEILSNEGVINVSDTTENEVTLTKMVEYSLNGVKIHEDSMDYEINVQFDPDERKEEAVEIAKAYALANDVNATEATVEDSAYYNTAMEMLFDRYVTRFDANYEGNFEDIETSIDGDFDLPTEGYFGSSISWNSSITNIKVNSDGEADVTRSSSDKNGKLIASFSYGASTNKDGKTISVTVEGKGNKGGSSGGGGGSSSGGGNSYIGSLGVTTTPAPAVTPAPYEEEIKGEFTDLGDVSWAAVAINYLAEKGIVSGRTSTTFAPNDNITRAEFAKIITGVFGLPTGGASAGFADVADDAWYAPYVNTCFAAGIITGYDSTTFGPDNLITRQDMAVMVMRAANLKGITVEAVTEKIDFADAAQIGAYAAEAVTTLQMGGIINGMTADTFAPQDNATRAQAAKILYSFCE